MRPLSLQNDIPLIWGHRGCRSRAAENTLRGIRLAKQAGADGCEIDVQTTRDGEIIVLHDLNLLRSTDAARFQAFAEDKPAVPWRFTLEQIRILSADVFPRRSCTNRGIKRPQYALPGEADPDVRVPTLDDVLRLVGKLGMWLNIEIKDLTRSAPASQASGIVERVHALVAARNMEDQVILSSFNPDYVRESKQLAPHVLTGLLTPHRFQDDPLPAVRSVSADAWHPGFHHLTYDAVRRMRDAGLAVTPYTVNLPQDMRRLMDWGVTGIVTDCPQFAP